MSMLPQGDKHWVLLAVTSDLRIAATNLAQEQKEAFQLL